MTRALHKAVVRDGGLIEVESSPLCEKRGVDFLWHGVGGMYGAQRKELHDFLASLDDGRLNKEIAQMNASVLMPLLILEGRLQTANGVVMTSGFARTLTISGLNKRLLTIASKGVQVMFANEIARTAELIVDFYEWSQIRGHGTAGARPKPTNDWGKLSNRDFQVHLLTGLPGIGAKTASDIIDALGRCPLRVDATLAELVKVPGVGEKTARRVLHAINGTVA